MTCDTINNAKRIQACCSRPAIYEKSYYIFYIRRTVFCIQKAVIVCGKMDDSTRKKKKGVEYNCFLRKAWFSRLTC